MVASEMAGVEERGQDVRKLTDLMERFHTLSKLYESKPKVVLKKEKTYLESSRLSPKHACDADEFLRNTDTVPKPMPPLVKRKGRKKSLRGNHENVKNSDLGKQWTAKLHSGKEVGVKLYRLKDSLAKENVLQSVPVPQDDIKYSFHQPAQTSISSEATLYQEALTSAQKYVNLNSRNHTKNPPRETVERKRIKAVARLDKANTIAGFNFDHETPKNLKGFKPSLNRYGDIVFAKGKSEMFAKDTRDIVGANEIGNVSKGNESGGGKSRPKRPYDETNASLPYSYLNHTNKTLGDADELDVAGDSVEEIFERNLRKATEKITEGSFTIEDGTKQVPTFLKMPKFVRSNEEMTVQRRNGKIYPERAQNLSATSYYISTHPYFAALSSISASDYIGDSPDSRISHGNGTLGRPKTPANTPQIKRTPSTSPMPRVISPQSPLSKQRDHPRIFPIASIQNTYATSGKYLNSESKKQYRKPLAGSKGKIRKANSLKDTNLETCVQGHALSQVVNETSGTESPVRQDDDDAVRKKVKIRREKSKSSGSSNRDEQEEKDKKPKSVFDACESFIIRSKQPIQQQATRTSPDAYELKASKLHQYKKPSPLIKLNTEMRKSTFVLARTDKNLNDVGQGPVRLVSDPVTFSVRHPASVSSYSQEDAKRDLPKLSRNVLLGRSEEMRYPDVENDDTTVVFYHHETKKRPHLAEINCKDRAIPELDELSSLNELRDSNKSHNGNIDCQLLPSRLRKLAKTDSGGLPSFNDRINGLKARQRSLEQLQEDRATFLRLMEQEILSNPSLLTHQSFPVKNSNMLDSEHQMWHNPSLAAIWKKFSFGDQSQKPNSYAKLTSRYPVKHDGPKEKKVEILNSDNEISKRKQLAFRLNYILPSDLKRRYTFPFGTPVKPPIKPVKSVSSGSEESGSKSLSITELNLDPSPTDRHRHWYMPNLIQAEKVRKEKTSNDDLVARRHMLFTLPEIQNSQFLTCNENFGDGVDSDMYIFVNPNSAAILPEASTSYRFANDVSFDEGSRYRTTDGFKGNISDHGLNGLSRQFTSAVAMRNNDNGRHELRISNRDHSSNGNHSTLKDAATSTTVRMEDRSDLPPTMSPPSPTISSALAVPNSNSTFIPPPSASRQNTISSTSVSTSNITFRLHKEKQNWTSRLTELSINGGGFSNSLPGATSNKPDIEPIMRMNMTSAVQRNLQTRERAMAAAPKSRISSRYSSKTGSACSEPSYSDPCIAAPPSFQQRLTDLSLLESETVKYEKNRKMRRKKNQDKDS